MFTLPMFVAWLCLGVVISSVVGTNDTMELVSQLSADKKPNGNATVLEKEPADTDVNLLNTSLAKTRVEVEKGKSPLIENNKTAVEEVILGPVTPQAKDEAAISLNETSDTKKRELNASGVEEGAMHQPGAIKSESKPEGGCGGANAERPAQNELPAPKQISELSPQSNQNPALENTLDNPQKERSSVEGSAVQMKNKPRLKRYPTLQFIARQNEIANRRRSLEEKIWMRRYINQERRKREADFAKDDQQTKNSIISFFSRWF